jgi:hypothetical protein
MKAGQRIRTKAGGNLFADYALSMSATEHMRSGNTNAAAANFPITFSIIGMAELDTNIGESSCV